MRILKHKEKRRILSGWKRACRAADRGMMIILILLMLRGIYSIYDSLYLYGYDPADLSYFFRTGQEEQREVPRDAVGWITFADTPIDYPVMQGKDNEEFLNKDPFGNFALSGSVFLDFRNDPDWKDRYNLLYVNPGAAGLQGWQLVRTALRFKIEEGRIKDMELFELPRK